MGCCFAPWLLPGCLEFADAAGRLGGGQLAGCQQVEDLLALLGVVARGSAAVGLGRGGLDVVTHGGDQLVEAGDDGGVGDAELVLDILDLAAALDEDLGEGELLAAEPQPAAEGEDALDTGAAAVAVQPRDVQLVAAHRALGGYWMHGWPPSISL
jgi:hypothetical protein